MKKKILSIITLASIMFVFSVFALTIVPDAAATSTTGFVPKATGPTTPNCSAPAGSGMDNSTYCGDYAVNDFVVLAVTIAQWILGIVGSLTLIMFVYGGIMFMISAGSSDKIAQAKKIIVASLIGLLIVFSSWMIIRFATSSIGAGGNYVFNGEIANPSSN